MPEYRIVFQQPPGGHPRRPEVFFDAEDDQEALTHMKTRWTRDEVVSLFAMPRGRAGGTQIRVWIRL